eukprot:scaffold7.g3700.t1
MASIRVLSLNISGHNVSSMAAASFSLMQKYQKIAELAARKAPQLLALQARRGPADASCLRALRRAAEGWLAGEEEPAPHACLPCSTRACYMAPPALRAFHLLRFPPAAQELHPFDCQEEMEALEAALQRAEYRRLSAARSHWQARAGGRLRCAALCLANEPFKEGATQRLRQVQAALESVGDPAAPLVLAGDCNMRVAEDKASVGGASPARLSLLPPVLPACVDGAACHCAAAPQAVEQLGLTDAWAAAGGSKAAKFTWDSRENLYHGRPESEGYTARYDRIYVRSVARVTEFKLVAGEVTPGRRDFLSDHYGVEASFEL